MLKTSAFFYSSESLSVTHSNWHLHSYVIRTTHHSSLLKNYQVDEKYIFTSDVRHWIKPRNNSTVTEINKQQSVLNQGFQLSKPFIQVFPTKKSDIIYSTLCSLVQV